MLDTWLHIILARSLWNACGVYNNCRPAMQEGEGSMLAPKLLEALNHLGPQLIQL